MLINKFNEDNDKIYEQDKFSKFVIQPSRKQGDLIDAT